MEADAARASPERPPVAPPSARDAPVASTSDPKPDVGTAIVAADAETPIETMTFPAFPHEPYGIQLDLMRALYSTLRRGGIGVFESPTGTGKTLSVLCSALQWLEDERRAERGAPRRGAGADADADGTKTHLDEPDWLRDFASNKRGRDASDRERRRSAKRAEARRRAAEADRAFFAAGKNSGGALAFGGARDSTKARASGPRRGKAAAEAAAVAAYAAAVSRGASRDDAIEEAEFLADDWSDETGTAASLGASAGYLRGDDTSSSDEEADVTASKRGSGCASLRKKTKRFKRGRPRLAGVDDSDGSEDDFPTPQIIFCSRTHSQLTQVVGELRSTAFGKAVSAAERHGSVPGANEEDRLVSAVAVAGRRQLCVNRDALETAGASASRLNERCLELAEEGNKARARGSETKTTPSTDDDAKKKTKGCPFLRGRRAAVAELAEEALAIPMDIEDLASAGVRRKACPYYAAREAHPKADLVFAPYASLLHKETRESLGVRLKDAVVVFDEAHNLAEAVHGAYGASLTGAQIDAVFAMVDAYVERFASRLSPANLRHLKTLKQLCAAFRRALAAAAEKNAGAATVATLNDFLFDAGADAVNVFALTKYLKESKIAHKIAGYGERARTRRGEGGARDAREDDVWDWEDATGDVDRFGVAAVVRRNANVTETESDGEKTKRSPTQPRVGSVHALAAFVSALAAADADGRVLVEPETRRVSGARDATETRESNASSNRGGRLKFVLLDAAARFRAVSETARAVILVGGTLSPIDELAAQLFPDAPRDRRNGFGRDFGPPSPRDPSFPPLPGRAGADEEKEKRALSNPNPKPLFSLSLGHVVPRDALLPLAVATGPGGARLDFSFGARDDDVMVDELGRILLNACAVAPGGVVVFFPSFKYADSVFERWQGTGVIRRLERLKTVFREPRAAADVEKTLRAFSDAVARFDREKNARDDPRDERDETPARSSKPSTQTGALLLCVCGGKLSEGINFKDALGRLVVMVGLPYANPEEPELRARMRYLDSLDGASGHPNASGGSDADAAMPRNKKSRGRQYYEALCMRSVNQSVGRAIRHVGDYAAILFCDRRYAPTAAASESKSDAETKLRGVPAQLAGWIGERLVTPSGYGQTQAGLARFFAGKRKKQNGGGGDA